jgi:hypothetical protein
MPVEIGQVDVVARPDEAQRDAPPAPAPAGAAGPHMVSDLARGLALEHSRDLRLRAD